MDDRMTSSRNETRREPQSSTELQLWVNDRLSALALAFNEAVSSSRLQIYAQALAPLGKPRLEIAFNRALRELKWFPKIAELVELAAVDDGRPGPETAWISCPKSEDESVVWTEETAQAFGSVRQESDQIAARMAFKEKYTQLVAQARREARPITWKVSLGWDKADRVRALSAAVSESKIGVNYALSILAPNEQQELRLALPIATVKQLPGVTENTEFLDPLQKVIKQLADSKQLPEPLTKRPIRYQAMTAEQLADRKQVLKEQAARLTKKAGSE